MTENRSIAFDQVCEIAHRAGLRVVGVTDASPLTHAKASLALWQENGNAGEMEFMKRDPALFIDPKNFLPTVQTLLIFSVNYERRPHPPLRKGTGRVAKYAWGRDYHTIIKKKLLQVCAAIGDVVGGESPCRVFTDAVPLLERGFAERAGLGFIGKNSLLIKPRSGSFSFLGEILLSAVVTNVPMEARTRGGCGSCVRCRTSCPTGAIIADAVVDARRCISYLTIEKRGMFTIDERRMLGEWIFGCDVCQDVCPFNHRALTKDTEDFVTDFSASNGVGPLLELGEVLQIRSDPDFRRKFAGTPLTRTKRSGLLRNASVVASNTKSESLRDVLLATFQHDTDPVIRSHALWAICELSRSCSMIAASAAINLAEQGLKDPAPEVSNESQNILESWK